MAAFPFEAILGPVSADQPAGPDLELEGDAEFMRFSAQIEGVLPESFVGFDRREANLPEHVAVAGALLKRSSDIRVLVAAAKLFILDRDLDSFASSMETLGAWIADRWEVLHPELLGGDPVMRMIALQSLDDNPHTVLPLQVVPLFKARRLGQVSLRSYMLAEGKAQPRQSEDSDEPERVPTAGDLASAIKDADTADVLGARKNVQRLAAALDLVESGVDEKTGNRGALRLTRLRQTVVQLVALTDRLAAEKDPTIVVAAPVDEPSPGSPGSSGGGEPVRAVGGVASMAEVVAALDAAESYFVRREPSSPIRMLLAQARDLVGKGFFEVLTALAPELAAQATIRPARQLALSLPMERLSQLLPQSGEATFEEPAFEETIADEGEAEGAPEGAEPDEAAIPTSDEPPQDEAPEAPAATKRAAYVALTRQEALNLLEAAAGYLRQTEPSSPIPMIIDHARTLAGRDFMTILRDLLPAQLLRVDDE